MKVVISGSRSIKVLPKEAINSLDKIIEQGFQILVGDAPGVDSLVQNYLKFKNYQNVVVYHPFGCRNNAGFKSEKVGKSYADRDKYMCNIADFGLAIWDGVSKGTAQNIKRVPKTKVIQPGKIGIIKVANKKTLTPELGYTDIYIGRPSPLGNPYKMNREEDRATVIELYHRWLWNQIKWSKEPDLNHSAFNELIRIAKLVKSGKNIRLVCWCSPSACHGDIIARAVNWLISSGKV